MGLRDRIKKTNIEDFIPEILDETTVKTLFYNCLVKQDTTPEDQIDIFLFDEAAGFEENNQVFTFSKSAVQKNQKQLII